MFYIAMTISLVYENVLPILLSCDFPGRKTCGTDNGERALSAGYREREGSGGVGVSASCGKLLVTSKAGFQTKGKANLRLSGIAG